MTYASLSGKSNVYEFASANIPCPSGGPYYQSIEQDLFLQTPTNESRPLIQNKLSNIGSLELNVGLNVPYHMYTGGCNYNLSNFIVSVILSSNTKQTLYIQIVLGNASGKKVTSNWCPDYESNDAPFFNQFCLDDSVENFGGKHVSPFSNVTNNIDILPRILQIIKTGHVKENDKLVALDTDASHWILDTLYFGMVNYGGQITTTQWSDVFLNKLNGGAFCSSQKLVQWTCEAAPQGGGWVGVGGGCYHRNTGKSC